MTIPSVTELSGLIWNAQVAEAAVRQTSATLDAARFSLDTVRMGPYHLLDDATADFKKAAAAYVAATQLYVKQMVAVANAKAQIRYAGAYVANLDREENWAALAGTTVTTKCPPLHDVDACDCGCLNCQAAKPRPSIFCACPCSPCLDSTDHLVHDCPTANPTVCNCSEEGSIARNAGDHTSWCNSRRARVQDRCNCSEVGSVARNEDRHAEWCASVL